MRTLAWGLALSPLIPPLSLLAPLFLPWLRKLPTAAFFLLLAYALSLLLPALPLGGEALLLAALRLIYVLGLVGAGVALARKGVGIAPLGYGLFLLFLSALLVSAWILKEHLVGVRLLHPYHAPVGLGFMGSLGVLLALHLRYRWPFRVLLGLLGALILFLAASRGGLLALAMGGAASLLFHRRGWLVLAVVGLVFVLAASLEVPIAQRFFQFHLSGREGLWLKAFESFQTHPWTGHGPYFFGNEIKGVLLKECFLFPYWEMLGAECPETLRPLGGLWTFAHNHFLQALGEGGLWGAAGLMILAGGFMAAAWGEGVLFSLIFSYLAMGMVDNPFSVPSAFRGEIFFLLGGVALSRGVYVPLALVLAGGTALLLSLPFVYLATRPTLPPPTLRYAAIPPGEGMGLVSLDGKGYRAQVWLCQKNCRRLGWELDAGKPIRFSFPSNLPAGKYQIRIVLLSPHRLAQRPRYLLSWEVIKR